MKRQTIIEIALFITLIAIGVAARVSLQHLPNFAPVAGLALFAGFFFRSRWLAMGVPLSIMAISDLFVIGGYAWWQMAVVYAMLTLPVLMRGVVRRALEPGRGKFAGFATSIGGVLGCTLLCSVLFFVVTNALCLGWYEPTWAGVARCYTQALPFFRFTLYGDIVFAIATFGAYAAVTNLAGAWQPQPAVRLAKPAT